MNSIPMRSARHPEPGHALLTAWHRILVRLHEARRRSGHRSAPPRAVDAEIRRRVGRDVPAFLRRDLGLDPDVL